MAGRRRRGGRAESQQPGLLSRVRLDLERPVVGPGDVEAAGHAHDVRRAVRLAVILAGLVFRRVPLIREFCAGRVQEEVRVVAFGRRHHPEAPVLGHDRHPVAGQIDRRRFLRCLGRRPAPRPRPALEASRSVTSRPRNCADALTDPSRTATAMAVIVRVTFSGSCKPLRRTRRRSRTRRACCTAGRSRAWASRPSPDRASGSS